jgi:hypothetical protein
MRTIALALVACLTAATLPAAEPPPVAIGSRVRAILTDGQRIEGVLVGYGPGGLTIETRTGRDATTLGLERIGHLKVAHGRQQFAGFVWGVLIGAGAAIGLLALVVGGAGSEFYGGPILAMGALLATIAGGVVGIATAPPSWRDARLPALPEDGKRGLGFRVAPVRGGTAVALTYAF